MLAQPGDNKNRSIVQTDCITSEIGLGSRVHHSVSNKYLSEGNVIVSTGLVNANVTTGIKLEDSDDHTLVHKELNIRDIVQPVVYTSVPSTTFTAATDLVTTGFTPVISSPLSVLNPEQTLNCEIERQRLLTLLQTGHTKADPNLAQAASDNNSPLIGTIANIPTAVLAKLSRNTVVSSSGSTVFTTMPVMSAGVKRELEEDQSDSMSDGDESRDQSHYSYVGGGEGAVDYSVTSPGYLSTDSSGTGLNSSSVGMSNGGTNVMRSAPRRATGPRKDRSGEKLTPEEEERRRVRRERNKHAAAKCRQKRVDLTNTLLEQTQELEAQKAKLQDEIKSFQQEKEELEFILQAHRLHCGVQTSLNPPPTTTTTQPSAAYALPIVKQEQDIPGKATSNQTIVLTQQVLNSVVKRPSTLSKDGGTSGVNVFTLGLDSMVDGHTGLTPITGMPAAIPLLSTPSSVPPSGLTTPLHSIKSTNETVNKNMDSKDMSTL